MTIYEDSLKGIIPNEIYQVSKDENIDADKLVKLIQKSVIS